MADLFLALKRDTESKVPSVMKILESIKTNCNESYYRAGSSILFHHGVNANYSLISLREIIENTILCPSKDFKSEEFNPVQSYKWMFLVYILSTKTLPIEKELNNSKVSYIFGIIFEIICKLDVSKPYIAPFLSGIISLASRIFDSLDSESKQIIIVSEQLYTTLSKLLLVSSTPSMPNQVTSSDFPADMFSLLCPLSMNTISPSNLFQDSMGLMKASVLRLLNRLLPLKPILSVIPQLRDAVQPLSISGNFVEMAIKVLTILFDGDESQAYSFCDTVQFKKCYDIILSYQKETNSFRQFLGYKDFIHLSKNLNHIKNISNIRPQNWVDFCKNNRDVAITLSELVISDYDIDFIIISVVLMKHAQVCVDDKVIYILFQHMISSRSPVLRKEVSEFLLLNPVSIVKQLPKIFNEVCNCGSRCDTFFSFLSKLLPYIKDDVKKVTLALIESIKQEDNTLQILPNSSIYFQLSQFIDVLASYLDPRPCMICNNPEIPATTVSLNDYRDYSKYTHNQIFMKLRTPQIIQSFSVTLSIRKSTRIPHHVKIFVSSAELKDLTELLTEKPQWRHVADFDFPKDSVSAKADLPLSLYATCIQFHFIDFWEESINNANKQCTMCHQGTPDPRSGLCPHCHENIYQCRECRNINYSHLDGFICSECGYSNCSSFDWSIQAIKSFSHTMIQSDNDCDASLTKCDELLASAHKSYSTLKSDKEAIENVLSPSNNTNSRDKAASLNSLYNEKCKNTFSELTNIVQHIWSIRTAVGTYKNKLSSMKSHTELNMCFNCRTSYIKRSLGFLVELVNNKDFQCLSKELSIPSVLLRFVNTDSFFMSSAMQSLRTFATFDPSLLYDLLDLFKSSMPNPSLQLVRLLCDLQTINDEKKHIRLAALIEVAKFLVPYINSSSSFIQNVVQPIISTIASSQSIMKSDQIYILYQLFNAMKKVPSVRLFDPLYLFGSVDVFFTIFLKCPSEIVRKSMASLLISASKLSTKNSDVIFRKVLSHISSIEHFSQESEQCISVFSELLNNKSYLLCSFMKEAFDTIAKVFFKEVDTLVQSEGSIVLDLSIGYSVYLLMTVFNMYMKHNEYLRYLICRKPGFISSTIQAYFKLRSLMIQRSKYIEDTLSLLRNIIVRIMDKEIVLYEAPASEEAPQPPPSEPEEIGNNLIDEYDYDDESAVAPSLNVAPLSQPIAKNDSVIYNNHIGPRIMIQSAAKSVSLCPEIVIRELNNIIFPPKVFANVPLIFKKIRSQEDFMPGRLPSSTVMSNTIGNNMRDIKNKICTDLGMPGLIEDDHGMELLVNGNIISLDLPIEDVYKKVWNPARGDSPMMVICRLQGLDGEATEPMISSFPRETEENIDPEIKYSYTAVLSESGGISELVNTILLPLPHKSRQDLIHLLSTFVLVTANRKEMNKIKTTSQLFGLMESIISNPPGDPEFFHSVIKVTQFLINDDYEADDFPEKRITFIFEALEKPLLRNNEFLIGPFLSLIPPFASRSKALMDHVLGFFILRIIPQKPEQNVFQDCNSLFMLNGLAEFVMALPITTEGCSVRTEILKHKVLSDAISFLHTLFPLNLGKKSKQWSISVENPVLPSLMKFVAGMSAGHRPTQELFIHDDNLFLKLLISLETVTSTLNIGDFASQILVQATRSPSIIDDSLSQLRQNLKEEERQKAQTQRDAILGKYKVTVPDALMKELEALGDSNGWECCVCKEGYETLPEELLSMYVYSNRIGEYSNTATHFTCVHQKCHSKDPIRDHHGRQIHTEWDAASIKNCDRPCNALFPLPHSSRTTSDYKAALVRYMEERGHGGDFFKIIQMDAHHHLATLSSGGTIAINHGGGSIPNSVGIIPILLYAGYALLECENNESRNRKSYESRYQTMIDNIDTPDDILSLSLWLLSLEEWELVKKCLLKGLLKSKGVTKSDSIDIIFEKMKATLIYFIIVHSFQSMIKKPTGVAPVLKDNGALLIQNHKGAPFMTEFFERINNEGLTVCNEWKEYSEEVEDEILSIPDLRTALIRLGYNTEDPTKFISELIE